jgi:hypothetical protein
LSIYNLSNEIKAKKSGKGRRENQEKERERERNKMIFTNSSLAQKCCYLLMICLTQLKEKKRKRE